jgi:hypothetical protein
MPNWRTAVLADTRQLILHMTKGKPDKPIWDYRNCKDTLAGSRQLDRKFFEEYLLHFLSMTDLRLLLSPDPYRVFGARND